MRAMTATGFNGYEDLKLMDVPKPEVSDDVADMIWKRATMKSFYLFAQPPAALGPPLLSGESSLWHQYQARGTSA